MLKPFPSSQAAEKNSQTLQLILLRRQQRRSLKTSTPLDCAIKLFTTVINTVMHWTIGVRHP